MMMNNRGSRGRGASGGPGRRVFARSCCHGDGHAKSFMVRSLLVSALGLYLSKKEAAALFLPLLTPYAVLPSQQLLPIAPSAATAVLVSSSFAPSIPSSSSSSPSSPSSTKEQRNYGPPDFVMSRQDVARLLLDGTNSESRPYMGSYDPKEAAFQDRRLLECMQTTGPDFEQCFFFGTTNSMIDKMIGSNDDEESGGGGNVSSDHRSSNDMIAMAATTKNDSQEVLTGRRPRHHQSRMPFTTTMSALTTESIPNTPSPRIPTW